PLVLQHHHRRATSRCRLGPALVVQLVALCCRAVTAVRRQVDLCRSLVAAAVVLACLGVASMLCQVLGVHPRRVVMSLFSHHQRLACCHRVVTCLCHPVSCH